MTTLLCMALLDLAPSCGEALKGDEANALVVVEDADPCCWNAAAAARGRPNAERKGADEARRKIGENSVKVDGCTGLWDAMEQSRTQSR